MRARPAAAAPLLAALLLIPGAAVSHASETAEPTPAQTAEGTEDGVSEDEEDDSVTQDDEGAPEPTVDASPTPTPTPTPTPEEPLEPEPEEADAEPEPELETDPAEDTDVPDETEPEEPEAFSFECPRTSINAGEQATLTINAPSGTQLSLGPGGSSLGASVSLSGSQLTYTAPESVTGTQQDTLTINGTSADGETFGCSAVITVNGDAAASPTPETETEPESTPTQTQLDEDAQTPDTEGPDATVPEDGEDDETDTADDAVAAPTPTEEGPQGTPSSPAAGLSLPGAPNPAPEDSLEVPEGSYSLTMPGMTGTLNPFTGLQQGARAGEDAAEGPFETEGTQASEEIGLAQTGATLWAAILALLALSLGLGAVRASRRAQSEAGRST